MHYLLIYELAPDYLERRAQFRDEFGAMSRRDEVVARFNHFLRRRHAWLLTLRSATNPDAPAQHQRGRRKNRERTKFHHGQIRHTRR